MELATADVIGGLFKPNFRPRTNILPVIERHRVDDFDWTASSGVGSKKYTVDGLTGVLEDMKDEFGVGEVGEEKDWA